MRAQPHCSSSLLVAGQSWGESKDVLTSPNQPALYQDLAKESASLHLWPWGDAAPWSVGHVLGCGRAIPHPLGEIHLYVCGEAAGFAADHCVWAQGIGSKSGLYVRETRQ